MKIGHYALLITSLLLASGPAAQADAIVQEYFVPMPEAQLRQAFLKLAPKAGSTLDSVISMQVPVNGTRVVFDHWEDGYEIDIHNPVQATTLTWGDGNDANGIPPGLAADPLGLPAGTVLALRNLVPLPRTSAILYDGRDRVGATQAIVMSRTAWATDPGALLADSTFVPSTADYGNAFTLPVGQDVIFPTPLTSSMFEYVAAFIMAAEDGTTNIQVDKDANGAFETSVNLNQGESYLVDGGILKGAKITSTKQIQVQLFTGDIGANYENRWYTIPPDDAWSSEYYSPVGTANDGDDTYIFLYNPNTTSIRVDYTTRTGSGFFDIPAKDTYRFLMPQNSGARFASRGGETFDAIGTVGAEPTANNVHDWGFSLVPVGNLSTAMVVGWGPGSDDLSPLDGIPDQNASPIWVTAVAPTTIYVDYNGDRAGPLTDANGEKYDVALNVAALEISRVYDPDKAMPLT